MISKAKDVRYSSEQFLVHRPEIFYETLKYSEFYADSKENEANPCFLLKLFHQYFVRQDKM